MQHKHALDATATPTPTIRIGDKHTQHITHTLTCNVSSASYISFICPARRVNTYISTSSSLSAAVLKEDLCATVVAFRRLRRPPHHQAHHKSASQCACNVGIVNLLTFGVLLTRFAAARESSATAPSYRHHHHHNHHRHRPARTDGCSSIGYGMSQSDGHIYIHI